MMNHEGPAGTLAALRASNPAPMVLGPLAGQEPDADDTGMSMLAMHDAQLADHADRLAALEDQAHTHPDGGVA